MAAIIGALRAELSASIAQFQNDMGKAADSLKGFKKQAQAISRDLESVGRTMSIAITAPLALLARAGLQQAKEARDAMGQVNAALESTGSQSGKTADELARTAKELQNISTFDDDDILRGVTVNLLTFGNVQGEVFDRAQKATVDLASRLGGDLQGAAIKVGRALQDPIKGIAALTRLGITFTDEQKKTLKALVQTNQGVTAQEMVLAALEKRFNGSAEAMRKAQPDQALVQTWRDFQEVIGAIVIKLLPPLTNALKSVVDWFNNLSPATQEFVVKAAALLAVVGPILVIFAKLISAVATLLPILKGLWIVISGLTAVTLGWVAGLAAVALAVVIFWKSIKDILRGDFKKAWEDAKDTATNIAKKIKGIFASVPTGPTGEAGKVPSQLGGATGGELDFNEDDEAKIKKTMDAAKALQKNIDALGQKIDQGLDATHLPEATVQANALNAQLDDYVKNAAEAGVNTKAFSGQVDALRKRITELQGAGLDKEAKAFSRSVDQAENAVKRFASNGLDPLNDRLDSVDASFDSLRDQIVKSIEDNRVLAETNDAAAEAMARLKAQLVQLDAAHQAAADAARAQYAAEERLANLQTQGNNLETAQRIRELQQARGGDGPISSMQQQVQAANDELARQQIEVATTLTRLEALRADAAAKGWETEVERLNSEIDLQTQLYDLVTQTTGEQLVAAENLKSAFQSFVDDLSSTLTDSVANWSFELSSITDIFRNLAKEMFIKPFITAGTDALGGLMKSALGSFAGGFDKGGFIPPGDWGIVGEKRPEVAFGGRSGVSVMPIGQGGGVTQVFNITTPDANSFRRSQRQVQRQARAGLSIA